MKVGDRVRYADAVINRCQVEVRLRVSGERGTITQIAQSATDTIIWVHWDMDGTVWELSGDLMVA